MKVYTCYNPRSEKGETFKLPTLTDQLADEPIDRIVQRFIAAGKPLPLMDGVELKDGSISEIDKVFAELASSDVSNLTKVEQLEVLQRANDLVAHLNSLTAKSKEDVKKAEDESKNSDKADDGLVEGKQE